MTFQYGFSDGLKLTLSKLSRRDPPLAAAVNKKIRQIKESDRASVEHFKNLRGSLSEYKRVHIGNFVLTFHVNPKADFILFERFAHHEDIY